MCIQGVRLRNLSGGVEETSKSVVFSTRALPERRVQKGTLNSETSRTIRLARSDDLDDDALVK